MKKRKFKLLKKDDLRFILLGSGYHICYLAELLIKKKFPKPIIVTQKLKNHRRDIKLMKAGNLYKNIFKIAEKYKLELIASDNCNDINIINKIKKSGNIVFSLSCRNILKRNFLKSFKYVFNIHPSYLPEEKGGGTFSWRIMNNSKEVSATIHIVNEKIDGGDILFQSKEIIKKNNLLPYDYLVKTNLLYKKLLYKFVINIIKEKFFNLKKQNKKKATYYPRLNTEKNGIIDWSWNIYQIERFIRAFSHPYPGCRTYIKKKVFIIKNSKIKKIKKNIHPYLYGRIINITNNYYDIICNGGVISFPKDKNLKLKISDFFYSPKKELLKSKKIVKIKNFNQKI